MTQEQTHRLMIENVLDNFNFLQCEETMRHLNWHWYHGDGRGYDSVTVDDLKETAIYLMTECIRGCLMEKGIKPYETYFHSTGGLKASTCKNKLGRIHNLKLEFVLSEWESDAITGYDIYKSENKIKKSK